jgi:hypothetical protein
MTIHGFIIGALFAAGGFAIARYTPWIVQNVAPIGWVEQHMASGASYFVYRMLGLVILFGGLLYSVGYLDVVVRALFGWIFNALGLKF